MSFGGHSSRRGRGRSWKRTVRRNYNQNESSTNNNQRSGYYNNRSGYRGGRAKYYNQRQYNNSNKYVPNNNRRSSYNPNQLQVNASRFARPQNTPQHQQKHSANFDTFAFPNDWDHSNASDVIENFRGWKASKPRIKYYTSDGIIYPDRVGVPQICCKGFINDIIDNGCTFLSEHFQIHPSLLPGGLSLMIFRKENSNFSARRYNAKFRVQDETQSLESGSQIRLKYSWTTFFQVLWINAKQNKHLGIEIPELGWKLAAIEKFEGSMQRNLYSSMQTALTHAYIDQNKYEELMQYFQELDEDFGALQRDHYSSSSKNKLKQQNQENIIEDCKSEENADPENDEDLIRNAKEAIEFFDKNKFTLSAAEPRFRKSIAAHISAYYLGFILPKELKHLHKVAQQLSDLLSYEWRIGVLFGEDAHIYIQFFSEKKNQFEVWAQLKQKLNIDKEGDDSNTYDADYIGKEYANKYFELMKKIFSTQKLELLELHKNEKEYIDNKRLLKQLNTCIPVLFFPLKTGDGSGPHIRPSKFKNDWLECCIKYDYPGKDILNKLMINDEGDIKSSETQIDELTKLMEQHTINDTSTN